MSNPWQETADEQGPFRTPADFGPSHLQPQYIGRYRIERLLGKGGFGLVYLARDDKLQRLVAIKVPHATSGAHDENYEPYLVEARAVASLDHPHIVPVHDVGSTEQFPCFVVSKFIDGMTLFARMHQSRFSTQEIVDLVATVAEALHHAHVQGIVHRDIKPGNILLDKSGKPFVADFGLALREQDVGKGPQYAGTPTYMSPEQARGEGHRVDGRSDIFSLGVVFYEMLTGWRPFRAVSREELLEQVMSQEPRPPRQMDDTIPKELERICLTALAKRTLDRYTTAKDMAEDLRHFLTETTIDVPPAGLQIPVIAGSAIQASSVLASVTRVAPMSDGQPLRIVPKGLRSFDEHDADFFLELLPGPRDRYGLPKSLRFWKTSIEQTNADQTFAVGLIYGPSGCGKSSMVKAGLLPRLSSDVVAIYIEATAHETESRLLKNLRHRCPGMPSNLSLRESVAVLRRNHAILPGKKVLLVIDQFEQWLHAGTEDKELIHALRQCDGARVQCIVMVRDDFWLAVSRFLRELDIQIVEGQNSTLTDLFDLDHARMVLLAFGRAFGKLPEKSSEMTTQQTEFLKRVVSGFAQDGKVISVRLALFSEMMKDKPWTLASLKEVGGTEGIGVTYLEEIFSASIASPEHRYHQAAARAVLKCLLPEFGTDIKGHMRSHQELLEASGYVDRPRDFEDLIRICDREVRLITPTDPEGVQAASVRGSRGDISTSNGKSSGSIKTGSVGGSGSATHATPASTKYYQLTHDYLVPFLREWLTRKQKETRRGRAELLLDDRANLWNSRPENRELPSLLQWLQIRWLTAKRNWTPPQRTMMVAAGRYHGVRAMAMAAALMLLGWGAYETHGHLKADALLDRLLDAHTDEVPVIVRDMASYRQWLNPLLHHVLTEDHRNLRQQLHVRLALLPVDASQVTYLFDLLLNADPSEIPVIRDALASHKEALRNKLWTVLESTDAAKASQRLPAASALATYYPQQEGERWLRVSRTVTDDLLAAVQKNPNHFATLVNQFRPVGSVLTPALAECFRSRNRSDTDRLFATSILADYAADNPPLLADLLMDADTKQFVLLFPRLELHRAAGLTAFQNELRKQRDQVGGEKEKEDLAKRQANAASGIWRLDGPASIRHLLEHSRDPTIRSFLIRRLVPLSATNVQKIMKLVADEPDVTVRRALVLSLGEAKDSALLEQSGLVEWLLTIFEKEADAGLHAAAAYVLQTLGEQGKFEAAKDKLRLTESQIQQRHADDPGGWPRWHVNGQGQTMVVVRGPVQFVMGSPPSEFMREPQEVQHPVQIGRSFAFSAQPVTVGDFRRLPPRQAGFEIVAYPDDYPITHVSWFDAVAYCNRLSRLEGIPPDQWCYDIDDEERMTKVRPGYLSLTGYRLPTEAEMEFVTRADTLTSRYFGESNELLSGYGWYVPNSAGRVKPAGRLLPNDFGLFDTLGNVWNWCDDKMHIYTELPPGAVTEDRESDLVSDLTSRVARGGCYTDHAPGLRSAHRWATVPTQLSNIIGFRIARTISAK